MTITSKILRLEAELQVRERTIRFLMSEYLSRHNEDREKVIHFLEEVIPDMQPAPAEIAMTLLAEAKLQSPDLLTSREHRKEVSLSSAFSVLSRTHSDEQP